MVLGASLPPKKERFFQWGNLNFQPLWVGTSTFLTLNSLTTLLDRRMPHRKLKQNLQKRYTVIYCAQKKIEGSERYEGLMKVLEKKPDKSMKNKHIDLPQAVL